MVTNGIRSEIELCRLNYYTAWIQQNGQYSPAVSRFTEKELLSGLPFYTENEPVRFARNKKSLSDFEGQAMIYAMRWLMRYNRRLERGLF
jgi:hypothetical protein